jgi:carbon-monoxide dehydrogenase large subunit
MGIFWHWARAMFRTSAPIRRRAASFRQRCIWAGSTPVIYVEVSAVFTNTTSIGPYRGSGRPEASYFVERLIDTAAREMRIDRAELRRRNTVPASAMLFKTGLVYTLDCGAFGENLERALVMAD